MADRRVCVSCGEEKPVDDFHLRGGGRRRPACKVCRTAAVTAAQASPAGKARRRATDERNRERRRAAQRAWRDRNPDAAGKHSKTYRERHPEAARAAVRRAQAARLVGRAPAAASYAEVLRRDPCSYCGGPGGEADHVEAVAAGGTNGWENLTGACRKCNASKLTERLLPFLLRRAVA